jgi:hypothetical protein
LVLAVAVLLLLGAAVLLRRCCCEGEGEGGWKALLL